MDYLNEKGGSNVNMSSLSWKSYLEKINNADSFMTRYYHYLRVVVVQDAIKYLQNNNFSIERCLDIGCNRGYYSAIFGNLGAQVDAVDPHLHSDLLIRHPNVTYYKADFLKWTLDKKYDIILFFEVYEHIPPEYRDIFIEKIKKSLNPGGIVLFSGPNCVSLFYSGGYIKSLIPLILGKIPEIDWHYRIPFYFYQKMFENDESRIVSWQTNGVLPIFSNKIESLLGISRIQKLLDLDRRVSRLTSGLGSNYFCIVHVK